MGIFGYVSGSFDTNSFSQSIQSRLKHLVKRWPAAVFLTFALSLTACGGGGGDPAPEPPATEAVWDQSNWNEKNWQ